MNEECEGEKMVCVCESVRATTPDGEMIIGTYESRGCDADADADAADSIFFSLFFSKDSGFRMTWCVLRFEFAELIPFFFSCMCLFVCLFLADLLEESDFCVLFANFY